MSDAPYPIVKFRRPEIKLDRRDPGRRFVSQIKKPGNHWSWSVWIEPKEKDLRTIEEIITDIDRRSQDPKGTEYRIVEIKN